VSDTSRSNLALAVLAFGAFSIGTAEFMIVGVLDLVARDLNVSIRASGYLVTAYALGISVGGPVATALTTGLGRKALLAGSLAIFVACNLVTIGGSEIALILAARFIGGTVHGLYVGVASVIAAQLAAEEQRGRAIAMVFGGIAVATVLGVPLGTLAAQSLGWRSTFAALAALGIVTLIAILTLIPNTEQRDNNSAFAAQARAAFAPAVLVMLALGFVLLGGQFTAFTYLVPFLQDVTGIAGEPVSGYLLIYGIASAVGVFIGGRFADQNATATLLACNLLLLPSLGALYWFGASPAVVAVALGVWGLVGFGLVPALQLRVITLAQGGRDLAATLSASAVNSGIAAGSLLGGWSLARHGVSSVMFLALVLTALAVPISAITGRLGRRHVTPLPIAPTTSGAN
jgi:DHA1 family inner membrane transport protein